MLFTTDVYPVGSLAEAVGFLSGQIDFEPRAVDLEQVFEQHAHYEDDFVDVKGQDYAKRALVIAVAGDGQDASVAATGAHYALPDSRRKLETIRISSAMGLMRAGQLLMALRPFRHPHHSVSDAGLAGSQATQHGFTSL